MPRAGKGGKRGGSDGTAYANRTDLNDTKALPIQADTGQGYGEAGAQRAAQRAMPLEGQNAGMPAPAPAPAPTGMPTPDATSNPLSAPTPTLHDAPDDPAGFQDYLDNNEGGRNNALGGVIQRDPEHQRILDALDTMAKGPYSSSVVRDLADFMRYAVI
jgi:hypothetical protein